jgi:hypothetical protein
VGKIAPAYVVVDVNKETFLETIEKRAPGAVAFQQDHAIVWWNRVGTYDAIGKRKVLIDAGHAVVHYDLGVFSHDAQNLATGQGRADRVSIGPGVRGHDQAVTRANCL